MSVNPDNMADYTDAQILRAYRWALLNNAAGQSRTHDGRSYNFPDLDKITSTIDWLEKRIAAASGPSEAGGGIALVEFGESQ